MVKIIRAESEKTLMKKVKECFFSRNESSYAFVLKEKNPLDSAFSVIHKVLRLDIITVGQFLTKKLGNDECGCKLMI